MGGDRALAGILFAQTQLRAKRHVLVHAAYTEYAGYTRRFHTPSSRPSGTGGTGLRSCKA